MIIMPTKTTTTTADSDELSGVSLADFDDTGGCSLFEVLVASEVATVSRAKE
jgi:hypothetical protein